MLSIAPVGSASGASNYFAKDDYYTAEGSAEISAWGGEGAADLGLSGDVTKSAFEAILNGFLPNGEGVGQVANRRAGVDLAFSMPKSASVMAYVAGDMRVLSANMAAVSKTIAWVEQKLAQGRRDVEGRKVPVQTGNLVYALFQHDTSRSLDPQAHIHAVVANMTRMPDGKWQALHADKIWNHNSVIGSVYHAHLRSELEKLGYVLDMKGKHGTFEIAGMPKAVLAEFSQRREDILGRAAELGVKSPEALREISKRSRDPKLDVEDRAALRQGWIDRAAMLGFDGKALFKAAEARAGLATSRGILETGYRAVVDAIDSARNRLGALLQPHDPLVEHALARVVKSPDQARAQLAVASAVRVLSEREAAWPVHQLAKMALDLGVKGVTIEAIEQRIEQLLYRQQLIPGIAMDADRSGRMATTPEAIKMEEQILRAVAEGKGRAAPVLRADMAAARLQQVADRPLNPGQLAAASLILSSTDRTVSIQGVAGSGKSTMLQAVARIAKAEGRSITGLAFQNKMVIDLAEGAGIKAQTIASFVHSHERLAADRNSAAFATARDQAAGSMLVLDESSMVSSHDMLRLHHLVEALGFDKLVLVGDRQQLSSINAGKAFAMIQAGGGTIARMDENIRQRTDELRTVAALANRGRASAALELLGNHVVERPEPAAAAADMWLALNPAEREITAIFVSGRDARAAINQRIQDGLIGEGSLKGGAARITVYDRINTTREELRHATTYAIGQTLEVSRNGVPESGLRAGHYEVRNIRPDGKIELAIGRRTVRFDPQKLSPTDRRDRLQLLEKKELHLRAGDRIRWTANDKARGLLNASVAQVLEVSPTGIVVERADQTEVALKHGDAMLSRIDLAYSLNMHMAQGITTDRAISVMSSHERHLSNQRLFNVGVTRVRDALTIVVDDKDRLSRQLDKATGNKASALETLGRLDIDPAERSAPVQGNLAASKSDLGLPDQRVITRSASSDKTAPNIPAAQPDIGIAAHLPERSLGLDL